MNTQSPQLDQADRELLVAYLDGELPPEDLAVVESRLASEAPLRQELQELQQSWDALSDLPCPTPAEDFTRTTLEMVAVAAQEDVESATIAMPVRRKRHAARIALTVLIAAAAGALSARAIWPDRNDDIIANLPVIENVEAYRHAGSIEFLRLLHENLGDELAQISQLSEQEVDQARQDWQTVSHGDAAFRRARIGQLDSSAAGNLHANWKRFAENTPDEVQAQLNDLHQQLLEDEQSGELFATLYRFGELLKRHSAGDKADLRSKETVEEQFAVVRGWVQMWSRFSRRDDEELDLTVDDKQLVLKWFRDNRDWSPRRWRGPGSEESEAEEEQRETALQDSLQTLLDQLSPQIQKALDHERENFRRTIFRLALAASPSWRRSERDEELQAYFVDELGNQERLRLLLMPDTEMVRELWQDYLGPLSFFGDGRGRGSGRRGGRGGRRDDGEREERGRGGPPGRGGRRGP